MTSKLSPCLSEAREAIGDVLLKALAPIVTDFADTDCDAHAVRLEGELGHLFPGQVGPNIRLTYAQRCAHPQCSVPPKLVIDVDHKTEGFVEELVPQLIMLHPVGSNLGDRLWCTFSTPAGITPEVIAHFYFYAGERATLHVYRGDKSILAGILNESMTEAIDKYVQFCWYFPPEEVEASP